VYDPPGYLWVIIIAGPTAVAALTCIALYSGAERAGMGRWRAALLADGAGHAESPGAPRTYPAWPGGFLTSPRNRSAHRALLG